MRADHERVRAAAVRAANQRRDPAAARVPTSTAVHRALLGAALLSGIVAVALVATPRNSPITLHDGMLPAGLLAVVSVSLLWWLEPRRANGSLWGSRVPAVIHLIFGVLWLLAAAGAVLLRWDEVDPYHALPETSGLTMLACAGVAAVFLWVRALRADRSGHRRGSPGSRAIWWISRMRRRSSTAGQMVVDRGSGYHAAGGGRGTRVRKEVLARLRRRCSSPIATSGRRPGRRSPPDGASADGEHRGRADRGQGDVTAGSSEGSSAHAIRPTDSSSSRSAARDRRM